VKRYRKTIIEGTFDPRDSKCVECGEPFIQPIRKQGGGSTKIYCSTLCGANSWARGNTEKRKISIKKYDAKPESKEQKKRRARKATLKRYGLTEESFQFQLERQRFRCLGCQSEISRDTACADHDHKGPGATFRGLLCRSCNWALGHAKDSRSTLYNLITYLRHDRTQYTVYIIGSLRNDKVMEVADGVRSLGCKAFDDWISAGPEADDYFQKYYTRRGLTYAEALRSEPAEHIFYFDKSHLDLCDAGILVMPAGKSGHLELGYLAGKGKRTFILQDKDPERYDIMPQFADTGVFSTMESLLETLKHEIPPQLRKPANDNQPLALAA
jgi:recombination endonuclease VII